jgi:hypothetical protein
MLGRPHVALCYPLLLGIAAQRLGALPAPERSARLRRWGLVAAAPLLLSGAALLIYNFARFGNPLEFGYESASVHPILTRNLQLYGQFNMHFVPQNLWTMLLSPPVWVPELGALMPNPDGMSLLITTPALIYLARTRRRIPLVMGAWLALGLLLIPLLTYYNTGWVQFGYRFSLDFMTPVMVLLATSAGPQVPRLMRVLILVGVAFQLWGLRWSGMSPP